MTNGGPEHGQQGWQGGRPPESGQAAGEQRTPPYGWQAQPWPGVVSQRYGSSGGGPVPFTLPGWGAIPAVLGVVLMIVGVFALHWAARSISFLDLRSAYLDARLGGVDFPFAQKWSRFYLEFGAFVAVALATVSSTSWTLGVVRTEASARTFGGITRKSLVAGRTGPTRVVVSVIAGIMLAYHVSALFTLSDNDIDELGPGAWLVVSGAALTLLGAIIGPRIPPQRR